MEIYLFQLILLLLTFLQSLSLLSPLDSPFLLKSNIRISYSTITLLAEQQLNKNDLTSKYKELESEKEKKQIELFSIELALKELRSQLRNDTLSLNATDTLITYDYGFISRSQGYLSEENKTFELSSVPPNVFRLSLDNFRREWEFLTDSITNKLNRNKSTNFNLELDENREKLRRLTLSNEWIWRREFLRPPIRSPWVIKVPYYLLCWLLDALFEGRPISRFYFLETVARMPYFSYITMLHTYETLGWWRRSTEAKRVHFAEEFNEFHHLLIWEALGGDQEWSVRFLAKHAAIIYFFVMIALWLLSPSLAYNFSELIEAHAVDTYSEFAESNRDVLQSMAPPRVAKDYYESPDLYVFDEFQTSRPRGSRRPVIKNLYDVVCAIRDDEAEHVLTMRQCQDPEVIVRSPNTEAATVLALTAGVLAAALLSSSEPQRVRELLDNLWQGLGGSSSEGVETQSLLRSETIREVGDEAFSSSLSTFFGDLMVKLSRFLR